MITNVGLAHIEFFGNREGVFKGKTEMFEWLNNNGSDSIVLYPAEDELFNGYFKEKKNLNPISFGFSDKADYKIHSIKIIEKDDNFVSEFKIRFGTGEFHFEIPFIGTHNVMNAAAAAAYAREVLSVDFVTAEKALKNAKPAKWRSDLQKHSSGAYILSDCYNANPSSFHALVETLALLKSETGKKVILVSGDMRELGVGSEKLHFELGEKIAKAQVDVLYSIGDFAKLTVEGATKAGIKSAQIEANKKEIYKNVINALNCDTILAIKGSRGAKLEELLGMFK